MATMPVGLRTIIRAYVVSIGIWCSLSVLTGWQYHIFEQEMNVRSSLCDMILLAESRGLSFALLTPPIFFFVRSCSSRDRLSLRYLSIWCLGVVPFMILYAVIRWLVFPLWNVAQQQYVPRLQTNPFALIRSEFADQITMYIAIVVAAHAYEYFARIRKQGVERSQYQQALAASELHALKMQLHPHFLFNTLHGITRLVDSDPRKAKEVVIRLSGLLRKVLESSGSDVIPLREELRFVREYLELEMVRVAERPVVEWSIAQGTETMLVPPLVLQPLIENAVRYGVGSSPGKSWINISSQKNGNFLELRICNTVGARMSAGTGVGLRNTRARLAHLYAGEATFRFSVEDQVATATLVLPHLVLDSPEVFRSEVCEVRDPSDGDGRRVRTGQQLADLVSGTMQQARRILYG